MRKILPHNDNTALRVTARQLTVSEIRSEKIKELVDEMRTLLSRENNGVALAAPQVGESLAIFIVSNSAISKPADKQAVSEINTNDQSNKSEKNPDVAYFNPKIIKHSRIKNIKHEGCLSIRGYWGTVPRYEKITLRYTDESGIVRTRGASGFLAHIFQHETDHLEGILYTDKANEIKPEKDEIKKTNDAQRHEN